MNKAVLSLLISLAGIFLVYRGNLFLYQLAIESLPIQDIQNQSYVNTSIDIMAFGKTYRIGTLCIGLLALYLGVIAYLKKSKMGKAAIFISLLLIILAFIPLWKYRYEIDSSHIEAIKNSERILPHLKPITT
ncbi:hypothetical protein [Aquimarina pacifica]|uniref:hypothetical protein n=1 Tax=Aquimarina pacifica TaxID=1296415 RepID=UPI000472B8B3|nr:hypothetical protein [Aquimarina pacifica]